MLDSDARALARSLAGRIKKVLDGHCSIVRLSDTTFRKTTGGRRLEGLCFSDRRCPGGLWLRSGGGGFDGFGRGGSVEPFEERSCVGIHGVQKQQTKGMNGDGDEMVVRAREKGRREYDRE